MQAARQSLQLPSALAKLDRFDLIILDDLSYARKDQLKTSVLFELIAERNERKGLLTMAATVMPGSGNTTGLCITRRSSSSTSNVTTAARPATDTTRNMPAVLLNALWRRFPRPGDSRSATPTEIDERPHSWETTFLRSILWSREGKRY
nr:hypothetical protein [Caballeronia concitans]